MEELISRLPRVDRMRGFGRTDNALCKVRSRRGATSRNRRKALRSHPCPAIAEASAFLRPLGFILPSASWAVGRRFLSISCAYRPRSAHPRVASRIRSASTMSRNTGLANSQLAPATPDGQPFRAYLLLPRFGVSDRKSSHSSPIGLIPAAAEQCELSVAPSDRVFYRGCVQLAALRAPPPSGRTLSLPSSL